MTALAEKSYNLKNVRLTFQSGTVADATELRIKRKIEFRDRTAGGALREQRVINKELAPEISFVAFNSDDLTFADLIPGDPITALTALSTETGTPSILQSGFFTDWPLAGMCIGDIETAYNEKDSSTFTCPIECGVLNPGALS